MEWLLVGLGNPGPQYELSPHNAGFLLVDSLAGRWGLTLSQKRHKSVVGSGTACGLRVALLKPQTFMNRSGLAISAALQFYKIPPSRLLVIHDELDLELGDWRLKNGGGLAGHNGLRSTVAELGTPSFARLRLGVGRPPRGHDVAGYLLRAMGDRDLERLAATFEGAAAAIEVVLQEGMERAMNQGNRKK